MDCIFLLVRLFVFNEILYILKMFFKDIKNKIILANTNFSKTNLVRRFTSTLSFSISRPQVKVRGCVSSNLVSGFTVVELMVVVAIFAVISSISAFNYRSFETSITVKNLAQDIALTIRKAQSYTLGFQSPEPTLLNETVIGYGVHFDMQYPDTFLLFGDFKTTNPTINANNVYDGTSCNRIFTAQEECVDEILITTTDRIEALCLNDSDCVFEGMLDIVFNRPNQDALFSYTDISTGQTTNLDPATNNPISHVSISVVSVDGVRRFITIWNTGVISVE